MRKYKVTVSYRPHFNSLNRDMVSFGIEARNKELAIFRAGWVMHVKGIDHVADSLHVEAVRI